MSMLDHDLPSKVRSLEDALKVRNISRILGKKFGITNGCFDLLHPGHLYFLQTAAQKVDYLWLFLNTAESIAQLKGPTRPILDDASRAYALSHLSYIAGVTFFCEPRLTHPIEVIQPDFYFKAQDYSLERLNPQERMALEACGAQIEFLPFLPGFSTTHLIEKIVAAQQAHAWADNT